MFNWMDPYTQYVAGSLLINTLLVLSLFLVYQCGILSLAIVGFMANGAYVASLLATKGDWPAWAAIGTGAILTGLLGLAFGLLVLHLRGIYLAMGTFAIGQICVLTYANLDYSGGPGGIVGIPLSVGTTAIFWSVVGVCAVLQVLHISKAGRALRALHLDDRVASGVGVNVARYRVFAFAGSGVIAGLAGGLEAFRTGVIAPEQYNFALLVQILALTMIGGSYHWIGGVIAAITVGVLNEAIGLTGNSMVEGFLYGGLLLVVMLVLPEGLVDRRVVRRLRSIVGRGTRPRRAAALDDEKVHV